MSSVGKADLMQWAKNLGVENYAEMTLAQLREAVRMASEAAGRALVAVQENQVASSSFSTLSRMAVLGTVAIFAIKKIAEVAIQYFSSPAVPAIAPSDSGCYDSLQSCQGELAQCNNRTETLTDLNNQLYQNSATLEKIAEESVKKLEKCESLKSSGKK